MKTAKYFMIIFFAVCLAAPSVAMAGNGYMGGKGDVVVADEPPTDAGGDGGVPDGMGPINDMMSDQGKLYGDLYVIQRYRGAEPRLIPEVDANGIPVLGDDGVQDLVDGPPAIGGEPVLTEEYGIHTATDEAGNVIVDDDGVVLFPAPYPSQCVQPLASYDRWGAIDSVTGPEFDNNRLPMVAVYDSTWERTECAVGEIVEVKIIQGEEGQEAEIVVGGYFIEPEGEWPDPLGVDAVYPLGVLWTDLIQEVSFGRFNLGRAPAAVLDHAFDEAVRSINSAIAIDIDPAGRLLLTREVYDEFMVDIDGNPLRDEYTGELLYGEIVTKAIDSPLENLALYVKLIQDGHLITPASDRTPIDRSIRGGVPIWKLLEMEDGPSDALRPTIDIDHFNAVAESDLLGKLVDASAVDYFTYWLVTYVDEGVAESRELNYASGTCDADFDAGDLSTCKDGKLKNCDLANGCEDWYGVLEALRETAGEDFVFSAAFLSAAGDKTGQVNVDKTVYLNSILDINKVVGYSAYNDDGTPADGAIDYTKNPVYFDFVGFSETAPYSRTTLFGSRGENKDGKVKVLVFGEPINGSLITWEESWESINENVWFENLGPIVNGLPTMETENIHGFAQMADDNLSVIEYIHTYQVPAGR